jgi:transcription termination factor Rho
LAVTRRLRKALQTQGGAAIEQLLDGLRKTTSNAEFLIQVSRSIS